MILGEDDPSRSFSLQTDRVTRLVTTLIFLVVVGVNPNVGDIVIEDLSYLEVS